VRRSVEEHESAAFRADRTDRAHGRFAECAEAVGRGEEIGLRLYSASISFVRACDDDASLRARTTSRVTSTDTARNVASATQLRGSASVNVWTGGMKRS
jgi:hypothetical protein